jgi:enoyl-CoA hydratase/carnithine racemase
MSNPSFTTPPPKQTYAAISFPEQYILLVTFNRPTSLNCINMPSHWELDALFTWFDNEPLLRCAIITGAGRAFCAGADLKEWNTANSSNAARGIMPPSGFGALSRRTGKKPIIAAVNGLAYGGGMEILANIDMAVLARSANVSLPEVKRGVVALAGALPRMPRLLPRPLAMEMALTGRTFSSAEALSWGLCNAVVDDAPAQKLTSTDPVDILARPVVQKALEYARMICANSPDSVIVSRAGVAMGWEEGSAENGARVLMEIWGRRLNQGENIREGLRAFVEKRVPRWVPSKL